MKQTKQNKSVWLKRRKLAIVAGVLLLAMLLVSISFVADFLRIYTYEDPADGTKYYIRDDTGIYALYEKGKKDGDHLPKLDTLRDSFRTLAGTTVQVDPETGETKTVSQVDIPNTDSGEVDYSLTGNVDIAMFTPFSRAEIISIEVFNCQGGYRFHRYDENGEVISSVSGELLFSDFPYLTLNQEGVATLVNATAVPNAAARLLFDEEEKAKYGRQVQIAGSSYWVYPEYGLAEETRVDEEGNEYTYTPDYFILTAEYTDPVTGAKSAQKHKVVVGDSILSQTGYYAQYYSYDSAANTFIPRDAVYVISKNEGSFLKSNAGGLVKQLISYPLNSTTYYRVQNLMLLTRDRSQTSGFNRLFSASYVPMEDRELSSEANRVFKFNDELSALIPSADNILAAMEGIQAPTILDIPVFAPSPADLAEYGLYCEKGLNDEGEMTYGEAPYYRIHFDYTVSTGTEASTADDTIYRNYILISEQQEDGTYYTYSYYECIQGDEDLMEAGVLLLPWICHVSENTLNFLKFDRLHWTESSFVNTDLAYCQKLTLSTGNGLYADFTMDNSETTVVDSISTERLKLTALFGDTTKHAASGLFGIHTKQTNTDGSSFDVYYDIGINTVTAYYANGTTATINEFVYAENALGVQTTCLPKPIADINGHYYYVSADEVVVKNGKDGEVIATYCRYAVANFKYLYSVYQSVSLQGTYTLSDEQEAALTAKAENLLLKVELTEVTKTGAKVTNTYCFYSLEDVGSYRKVYLSINGEGGFYVTRDIVDKFLADVVLFMNDDIVQATWDA